MRQTASGGGALALSIIGGLAGMAAATGLATVAGQETTMTRLFAPVEIGADLSRLPDSERQALTHIIAAARMMDGLFLQQVWAGNPSMLLSLLNDDSAAAPATLDFFLLNKGPWSRIEDNRRFVAGAPVKPEGAKLLSGRRHQGRRRGLVRPARGRGAGRRDRVLHDDPAWGRRRVCHRAL